jgi:hypothetical protein
LSGLDVLVFAIAGGILILIQLVAGILAARKIVI